MDNYDVTLSAELEEKKNSPIFGVISLVTGALALVLAIIAGFLCCLWIPSLCLAALLALVSIVMAIIAFIKKSGKGFAIGGIITAVLAIGAGVLWIATTIVGYLIYFIIGLLGSM